MTNGEYYEAGELRVSTEVLVKSRGNGRRAYSPTTFDRNLRTRNLNLAIRSQ